ncbi:MAG: DNA pilot protein [Microviridae sp.]|nr:MAG: DNA pilot protein [Microviridae sp.]
MPISPPILGGLISAGSNIVDSVMQGFTNRANRKWSEKMYNRQRQDALADWNMQNAYNTPEAQMARYKAAGLNPNLIYGSGTTTNSVPVRSSSPPAGQAKAPSLNLGSAMETFMRMKSTDSQIMLNGIEGILKTVMAGKTDVETQLGKFNLGQSERLADVNAQLKYTELQKMLSEIQVTLDGNARANAMFSPQFAKAVLEVATQRIQNAKTSAEISEVKARVNNILADTRSKVADAKLREKGIQPHDSALMRWLQGLFDNSNTTRKDNPEFFDFFFPK